LPHECAPSVELSLSISLHRRSPMPHDAHGASNAPFASARLGAGAIGNILVDNGYNTARPRQTPGNKVSSARL
jgi:hypothetical protein